MPLLPRKLVEEIVAHRTSLLSEYPDYKEVMECTEEAILVHEEFPLYLLKEMPSAGDCPRAFSAWWGELLHCSIAS